MRPLSPWSRKSPGKVHIGEPALSTSTSIWAQNDCSLGCTSAGNHGTSTSTSIPTSASGSALSGAKPAKHGLKWPILLQVLPSNTAMPANSATSAIICAARALRPP